MGGCTLFLGLAPSSDPFKITGGILSSFKQLAPPSATGINIFVVMKEVLQFLYLFRNYAKKIVNLVASLLRTIKPLIP
jgi:hypothetical protein